MEYLKETYGLNNNSSIFDVNKDVLEHLRAGEHFYTNGTRRSAGDYNETEQVLLSSEIEFWQPSGRRIYQGTMAKITRFPFMAAVQFFKKFQCGGSIIKSDLVITSASCLQLAWNNRFYRENPNFLSVLVGSHFYETGRENIPILEIYFNPSYNPKNLRHNLAIIRLTRILRFDPYIRQIKKIDIDRTPLPMATNTDGILIVGWGARGRDAGGPGVVDGILYGVVSFGSPVCGTPDAPTVFTKLGFYTNWIEEILELVVPKLKIGTTTTGTHLPRTFVIPMDYNLEATTSRIMPVGIDEPSTTPGPPVFMDEEIIPVLPTMPTIRPDKVKKHLKNGLRQGKPGKAFKDFLSTMFESNQVEDYMEGALNEKDSENEYKTSETATDDSTVEIAIPNKIKPIDRTIKKRKKKKPIIEDEYTTEEEEETKQVTAMNMEQFDLGQIGEMENLLLKSHTQPTADATLPLPPKSPTPSKTLKTHKKSSDDVDKKLEQVIVSLIDNLDVQDILESNENQLSLSQESQEDSKERLVEAVRRQKAIKDEELRKAGKYQDESILSPKLDQATIKEIAKVMNMDESVLTFLYLNNMKSKQNATLQTRNKVLEDIAFKNKARFKISRKQAPLKDDEEDDEEDEEEDGNGEEYATDEAYTDEESEALSIPAKPSEPSPDNALDVEDIYETLLEVVGKDKLKGAMQESKG
ncbi:unnamed protein product [Chrysodeixis includens]|uniref:Peptidase S1 domain-containing protein n=1 Tax=Chrysodeixis includens TaxID=689277 RepID=A0A9P0FWF6_CHRIL|nr:unnamed protein product [Chrysodeixis includens]